MRNMNTSDTSAILGTVQWNDEGSYLKEVIGKGSLPQLVKVIKGQYISIGVPSLANPSLSHTLFLTSAGNGVRISAQCVKFKEGRRVVPVGPRLAIPDSYEGYFEILSEDGRSVKCMESVSELSKRFPDSCLVRETLKAYVSRSDDIETITEKSRFVAVGETLVLVGEVTGSKNGKNPGRFLRCFDQSGQNLYLPYDAKGKFSPIAKEDNIGGVHSIKNLLNKRLPLMVRLIHGKPPIAGFKASSNFLPELRLYASFTEEAVAAQLLGKDSSTVILPPTASLKVTQAKNADKLQKMKEFSRLCERSAILLQEVNDKVCVYDTSFGSKSNSNARDPRFHPLPDPAKQRLKNHAHNHRTHRLSKSAVIANGLTKGFGKNSRPPLDDYDEIDQIYDYVRGFAPLPKHLKSPFPDQEKALKRHSIAPVESSRDEKPTPPPIDTIPTRKGEPKPNEKLSPSVHPALISAVLEKADRRVEKRARNASEKNHVDISKDKPSKDSHTQENTPLSNNKLFVKASHNRSGKTRMFRQKSSSAKENVEMNATNVSSSPSPFFKLRYKSLTNLAMDFDTLDSSTSGGKGSADSSGSAAIKAKLPEKKSRKLVRPKSLTNLVWDVRGNPFESPKISPPQGFLDAERNYRLEPGVYRHVRDAPALLAATTRLLASQKKLGTLYL